jgi:hypothetical protein
MRANRIREHILGVRLGCKSLGEGSHQVWVNPDLSMEIAWAVKTALRRSDGFTEE